MKWIPGALAIALAWSVPLGAGDLELTDLELTGPEQIGCAKVRGTQVAFLVPSQGILLLATSPFPGGDEIGSVRQGRLEGEVPRFGTLDLDASGSPDATIWGMLDTSLHIGDESGCFGFGQRRFSDVDDLKTYLHWWVKSVLRPLPDHEGEAAPAVWLEGRRITIQIESPQHRSLEIRGTEGTTVGFQPPGSTARIYFQPFVLGVAAKTALVRVSMKEGDFFGDQPVVHLGLFVIGPEEAVSVLADPPTAIRLTAIEDKISFINRVR